MKLLLLILMAGTALAAPLYFAVSPDSHFVVLDRTGDTLWKSHAVATDSFFPGLDILGSTWLQAGDTIHLDTAAARTWLAGYFLGLTDVAANSYQLLGQDTAALRLMYGSAADDHARQHSITSTSDHTSTATSGQILQANADGLPVDASNTDAEVAAAVSASHAQNTDTDLDATFEATFEKVANKGAVSGYCGLDGSALVDGDDLPALSTTKKGGAPATGTPSGKFLRDDATWQTVGGSGTVTDFHESLGVKLTPNPITTSGVVFLDTATVHTWVSGWAPGGTPDSDYVRITADSGRIKVLNGKMAAMAGLYHADTSAAESAYVSSKTMTDADNAVRAAVRDTVGAIADINAATISGKDTSAAGLRGMYGSASVDPSADEKAALAGTDGTPSVTNKYVTNSDSRNSDARTPTAHTDSHKSGGADDIPIDSLAAAADNTLLNATTSAHGLIVKAVAPAAGIRNVVAIDNTETNYKVTALVDNTNPEALGAVGPGTQLVAARRDHVHPMPAIRDTAAIVAGDSADAARSDAADSAAVYAGDTAAVLRAEAPTRDTSLSNPSTIAVNAGLYGQVTVTGLAQTLTIGAPTGSPLNGQRLTIRIKDDGTTRPLSWNGAFKAYTDVTLSTGTTAGKTMYWQALYNSTDSKWDVLASQGEP